MNMNNIPLSYHI